MLRILQRESSPGTRDHVVHVHLAGQLRAQWVRELRHLCDELLAQNQPFDIDMTDVLYADADGVQLLRELAGRGVALTHCALFIAEQLKTAEQDA